MAKIKGRPRAAEGCCPLPGGSSEKDADLGDAGARVAFHSVPVGPDEAQRGGWDGRWVWGFGADPERRGRGLWRISSWGLHAAQALHIN